MIVFFVIYFDVILFQLNSSLTAVTFAKEECLATCVAAKVYFALWGNRYLPVPYSAVAQQLQVGITNVSYLLRLCLSFPVRKLTWTSSVDQ